jgi:peptide/nickel transport system substrate-binding protein
MRKGSQARLPIARQYYHVLVGLICALYLTACGSALPTLKDSTLPVGSVVPTDTMAVITPSSAATATDMPPPPPLLTICLGKEPASLFLYDANSMSALGVLAAVYDGPFDIQNFEPQPVILAKLPSLEDGDVTLEPVEVQPGELIVDADGVLKELEVGIVYRPSGCMQASCALSYAGDQPALLDQLRIRFELLPGITWSDGEPLKASDSVYSFEIARELYPTAVPDLIDRSGSYQALDELTLEWVGLPGYLDGQYHDKFFSPLPEHIWGALTAEELRATEAASRTPLGWGPYVIDEWTAGDHISLHSNPNYFRKLEGLPNFDHLVYRFVAGSEEALQALLAGECDLVDQTALLDAHHERLLELQAAGSLTAIFQTASAWELIALGIDPIAEGRVSLLASSDVRQALAACIDRQAIAEALFGAQALVADSYLPPSHPLYNDQADVSVFDPQGAASRLEAMGWLDDDGDPGTPRLAQGIPGIVDSTPFSLSYLVSADDERQQVAQLVKEYLAQCGVQLNIATQPFQEYLAAGPEGPVFGRNFDLAHFAWSTSVEPPCYLFLSSEIPGEYPQSPKGWGGVNASGYSNPAYDQACNDALFSLPDAPEHREAHFQAQAIFAQDLPSIPLYWRFKVVVTRPDMCGVILDPSSTIALTGIEEVNYGEGCR